MEDLRWLEAILKVEAGICVTGKQEKKRGSRESVV